MNERKEKRRKTDDGGKEGRERSLKKKSTGREGRREREFKGQLSEAFRYGFEGKIRITDKAHLLFLLLSFFFSVGFVGILDLQL